MAKYINPYTDFGFKKLFGEEANKDLLPEEHQIEDLSFKNVEQLPDLPYERKVNLTQEQKNVNERSWLNYLEIKAALNTAEMDGQKKAKYEIAKGMKLEGFDLATIKRLTGLLDDEINKL
jgi:hypothetical protein